MTLETRPSQVYHGNLVVWCVITEIIREGLTLHVWPCKVTGTTQTVDRLPMTSDYCSAVGLTMGLARINASISLFSC